MKHLLAIAAALIAGSAHAQAWTQFIPGTPLASTSLVPSHGLREDTLGGIVVGTTTVQTRSGLSTGKLYAFDIDGTQYSKPTTYTPADAPPLTLTARALTAYRGHRVAWYEVASSASTIDAIVAYPPFSNEGIELRMPRVNGSRVVQASTDGKGGVVVIRKPAGWSFPIVERLVPEDGAWRTQWSANAGAGGCPAGTRDVLIDDAVIDLDTYEPEVSKIHVLGHCDGGVVQSNAFTQYFHMTFGASGSPRPFNLSQVATGTSTRHALGQGAWMYESLSNGNRVLRVADHQRGVYALTGWPGYSGPITIDRVGDGGLLGAHNPQAGNTYMLARVQRAPTGEFRVGSVAFYPSLSTLTDRRLHWSEDSAQQRVVAYRGASGSMATVQVRGFTSTAADAWQRTISTDVANAEPQLVQEPFTDRVALAVDLRSTGFTSGVYVESFKADGSEFKAGAQ